MWFGQGEAKCSLGHASIGILKFNVDGAARGKPGPASIGGVLHNDKVKFWVL